VQVLVADMVLRIVSSRLVIKRTKMDGMNIEKKRNVEKVFRPMYVTEWDNGGLRKRII